ncbi:MAG: hypothetical protein Q7R49_02320 [Candidatus Daviesbacteria bacterium]|nr:hypothetical protein [Candidatus Daviesbacteria bacterium]
MTDETPKPGEQETEDGFGVSLEKAAEVMKQMTPEDWTKMSTEIQTRRETDPEFDRQWTQTESTGKAIRAGEAIRSTNLVGINERLSLTDEAWAKMAEISSIAVINLSPLIKPVVESALKEPTKF